MNGLIEPKMILEYGVVLPVPNQSASGGSQEGWYLIGAHS